MKFAFKFVGVFTLALLLSSCRTPTPSSAFLEFYQAAYKRDLAALKSGVSAASLVVGEQLARGQNQSLDEFIAANAPAAGEIDQNPPAIRNESVNGEQATIEIKFADSSRWTTIPFVREAGIWKISFDKLIAEGDYRIVERSKSKP